MPTHLNWKTLEADGPPVHSRGWDTPYISCIVYSCNPEAPQGGVIETCRWDVENKQWFEDDIRRNWYLHEPYVITHYVDDAQTPFTNTI